MKQIINSREDAQLDCMTYYIKTGELRPGSSAEID